MSHKRLKMDDGKDLLVCPPLAPRTAADMRLHPSVSNSLFALYLQGTNSLCGTVWLGWLHLWRFSGCRVRCSGRQKPAAKRVRYFSRRGIAPELAQLWLSSSVVPSAGFFGAKVRLGPRLDQKPPWREKTRGACGKLGFHAPGAGAPNVDAFAW